MKPQSALIVGAGYVGRAAGEIMRAKGAAVTGWVRSIASAEKLRDAGWSVVAGDVTDHSLWESQARDFDAVVYCPSTRGAGPDEYRRIHIAGLREALACCPAAHFVYTSSTSVYGQNDGSIVTEDSPACPDAGTALILLEAESLVLAAGGAVLRIAAIYGPGRGVLYRRLLNGEAMIPEGPDRWINAIHRDDVAGAIDHAVAARLSGIFNVSDNEPATHRQFYEWLCGRLGCPLPPVQPLPASPKKRGSTRKRVSSSRLRATGWQPRFPTFREGYDEIIRAVPDPGLVMSTNLPAVRASDRTPASGNP